MKKFTSMLKATGRLASDNSPVILTGLGVAGTLLTAFFTAKATFEAAEIICEQTDYEKEVKNDPDFELTTQEKIRLIWPRYIPAAGTAIMTITCIIAANRIGTHRAAGLAAAYSTSQQMFEQYQKKVTEKLGAGKEQKLRDEVAQDMVNGIPEGTREIQLISSDDVYCYDAYTGRLFKSNMQKLKEAELKMGYKILHEDSATLNDFHNLLGLDDTEKGEELGWNHDVQFVLDLSTTMHSNKPCFVINFKNKPRSNPHRYR